MISFSTPFSFNTPRNDVLLRNMNTKVVLVLTITSKNQILSRP